VLLRAVQDMLDSLCEDDWLGLLLMEAAASAAKAGSAAKAMRRGWPAEVPLLQRARRVEGAPARQR